MVGNKKNILSSFDTDVGKYGTILLYFKTLTRLRGCSDIDFPVHTVLDIQTNNEGRKVMVNIETHSTQLILTLISI